MAKFAVILHKKEGSFSLLTLLSYSSYLKFLALANRSEIFKYEKTLTKSFLIKNLRLLRKYKLRLNLNKYKFEEKLLYKLKNFIVKYYNKKVEFNIVNIRSVVFHSDFFTKIILSKLKNRRANVLRTMDTILNKVVLPKVNRIIEKSFHIKGIDFNLLENKYLNTKISYILDHNNLSKFLNKLYYNVMNAAAMAAAASSGASHCLNKDYLKIYEIIFNSINYKNMGGVRLEAKGRLTKRYRADRSQFKLRWKGGLKNIDSSFKGLSDVKQRGYLNPNICYTIATSKRRIGAFAVKGWVSGKSYSTKANTSVDDDINPWVITGFTDAEGSFIMRIRNNNKCSAGYSAGLVFQIGLHKKDLSILENIKSTLKVGVINDNYNNSVSFKVTSFKDLKVIINHFDNYPLITQKLGDFILFKQAFNIMNNKEHLTIEGIRKLVGIKAKLNLGLTEELSIAFPNITSVDRSFIINQKVPDSNWLTGFTSGEGCFFINIIKSKSKLGVQVQLVFTITQHDRDRALMNSLISFFDCGYIKEKSKSKFKWLVFTVTKFSDINDKIIPFFHTNKIIGVKSQDFNDWCKVAKLIETKAHLTESGLEEIYNIKSGMNKGRVIE